MRRLSSINLRKLLSKMMNRKELKASALAAFLFIILLISWIVWGNKALAVNEITVSNSKIPDSFDGFRIVQISDLHNAEFGENNSDLLSLIEKSEPDIILITGDLIDSRHTDIEIGINFAAEAQNIAPTYYVSGNHEARLSEYMEIENALIDSGVTVLNNESVNIEIGADSISLYGVKDLNFYFDGSYEAIIKNSLQTLDVKENSFNILMAHHPEYFDFYVSDGYDLVFSGHAHGGQIRLPFIGGVIAPGQGFFPEYDSGVYTDKNTSMIVSRGIGNSLFPFRVNNRPEIIIAELNKTEVQP